MREGLQLAQDWFIAQGWTPFDYQKRVWEAICAGESGLVHAGTGMGKTYSLWMGILAQLMNDGCRGPQPIRAVWITPLRALATDIQTALQKPVDDLGLGWKVETRTGDTPASSRARQAARLPFALVTTPESLTILLSCPGWEQRFSGLRFVVVDEWHELLSTKRGVQSELALARLGGAVPGLRVWGLSATLGNLEGAMAMLLGAEGRGVFIRGEERRRVHIQSLLPDAASLERFPWAGHLGIRQVGQVVRALEGAETSLLFTNTRSQTELWGQAILAERPEWAGRLALHHGSLDADVRRGVEEGLRQGRWKVVVCTSSLDLGVDFSPVELTLQVGSPKGVARLLQRAGRSGHRPGAESRVVCIPTHAFELVEIAAARDAVHAEEIEARASLEKPLDVLAQHLVTAAAGGGFRAEDLFSEVRSTWAYRNLSTEEWDWVMDFVTRGGQALSGYPEYARVARQNGMYLIRDLSTARRHRMQIGSITSDAELAVRWLGGARLGSIEESFVARLKPGDAFLFGGRALELVRIKDAAVWVKRASAGAGVVPKWMGGRMPLSTELAGAVRRRLHQAKQGIYEGPEMAAVRPLLELQARWSAIPAEDELLIERVKTREGFSLFFYPFAGRLVHEGLSALFAYRLSRLQPVSFSISANDYGFELLSSGEAPLEEGLKAGLLGVENLLEDILASLNAAELARRHFREVARVAGLVFQGYPGNPKTLKQTQASSGLLYDVFARYDPENLLLAQARREALERQLEEARLAATLRRIAECRVSVKSPPRPTPLAFPLLVDLLRERVSSEKLEDRVRKLVRSLERAAQK